MTTVMAEPSGKGTVSVTTAMGMENVITSVVTTEQPGKYSTDGEVSSTVRTRDRQPSSSSTSVPGIKGTKNSEYLGFL